MQNKLDLMKEIFMNKIYVCMECGNEWEDNEPCICPKCGCADFDEEEE